MQAGDKRLVKFLEGNDIDFVIPVYQRSYDWQIEQCKRLWNDIKNIIKYKRSHFFGSIVSVVTPSPQITEFMIIDGQQRLTTISLFMAAICNLVSKNELDDSTDVVTKMKNEYLINKYRPNENKLRLKLIQKDREAYDMIINNEPNFEFSQSMNLYRNYEYFCDCLKSHNDMYNLEQYMEAIRQLFIVDIQLKAGEDDPQLIFESLNSTGLALSEADKIRNFVLMNLTSEMQTEYYKKYWTNIENNSISAKNGVSDFVRDYLTIQLRRIPRADHVYFEFKEYVSQLNLNMEDILKDLLRFSNFYRALLTSKYSDSETSKLLGELNRLDNRVLLPYLLELFNNKFDGIINENELKVVLRTLEIFLFRRTICSVPTNALNKLFAIFEKDIRKYPEYKENYTQVMKYVLLEKQSSSRFPNDDEFKSALLSRDIYNMQSKNKIYLLEKLENYNNKEVIDLTNLLDKGALTIEHIMPQTLTSNWEEQLGIHFLDVHSRLLHTIGNLTLTAYNSSYKNFPFERKRDMEHGFRESKLRLNDYISKCEIWTEQQINERAKQLSQLSLKCWPKFESTFEPQKNHELTYSIDDDQSFRASKIESFEFKGKEYNVLTWTDFYKQVIHSLYEEDSSIFASITNESSFASDLSHFFTKNDEELRFSFKIAEDLYIELNHKTDSKLRVVRNLLTYFDQDEINLRFTIRQEEISKDDADSEDLLSENQYRGISTDLWIKVLNNPKIFSKDYIEIIFVIFSTTDHKINPSYLAEKLEINYPSLNLKIVKLSSKIVEELEIPDQVRPDGSKRYWNIAFVGEYDDDDHMIWTLRNELVSAIYEIGEDKFEKNSIVDRYDWEIRSSEKSLNIVDMLLKVINNEFEGYELKYNQPYIGLQKNGKVSNFMTFSPRKKSYVLVKITLPKSKQFEGIFNSIGVKSLEYIDKEGVYRFRVDDGKIDGNISLFRDLIKHAKG